MTAAWLTRFRKVCGLLGSDQDGERAVAAAKASAMLQEIGKSWVDVGVDAASPATAHDNEMMDVFYKQALGSEQARTTKMAEEITRLKREVARLKGMWPKVPA